MPMLILNRIASQFHTQNCARLFSLWNYLVILRYKYTLIYSKAKTLLQFEGYSLIILIVRICRDIPEFMIVKLRSSGLT